jgi:phosphatidylglycerophosphate synthase
VSAVGESGMGKAAALIGILAWPNNLVTLARMVAVSVLVAALAGGWRVAPPIGWVIFVIAYWCFDYLDGWLARRLGRASAFGETLDLLADRWCDIVVSIFLIQHVPGQTSALVVFLLLRIAPEVVLGRFVGTVPGLFQAAATHFVSESVASRSMDLAAAARTIFFAWALFGHPPAWVGLLLIAPAVIFAGLAIRVLAELADQSLSNRIDSR